MTYLLDLPLHATRGLLLHGQSPESPSRDILLDSPMAMFTARVELPAQLLPYSMPEKDLPHGNPDIVESVGTGSGSERAV